MLLLLLNTHVSAAVRISLPLCLFRSAWPRRHVDVVSAESALNPL